MSRPQNIASKGLASRGIAPNANLLSRTYSGPHADEAVLQYLQTRSDVCEGPIEIYIDTTNTNDTTEVIPHHHHTHPQSPEASVPFSSSEHIPSPHTHQTWKKRWITVGHGFISVYEYLYGDTPLSSKGKLIDKIPFDTVLSLRTMCESIRNTTTDTTTSNSTTTANLNSNEFLIKIQGSSAIPSTDETIIHTTHNEHFMHNPPQQQPQATPSISSPFSTVSTPDSLAHSLSTSTIHNNNNNNNNNNNDSFFIPRTRTVSSNLSLDTSIHSVASFYTTHHGSYTIRFRTKTADERRHWVFSLQKVLVMGIMDFGRKSLNITPSITPRGTFNNNNNHGTIGLPRIESISTMLSNDTNDTNTITTTTSTGPFGLPYHPASVSTTSTLTNDTITTTGTTTPGLNRSNVSSFLTENTSNVPNIPFTQYSSSVAINYGSNTGLLSSSFHPSLLRNQPSFGSAVSTTTNGRIPWGAVAEPYASPHRVYDSTVNRLNVNNFPPDVMNLSRISQEPPTIEKDQDTSDSSDSDDDYVASHRTKDNDDDDDEEDIFGNTISPKKFDQRSYPSNSSSGNPPNTNKVQISGRLTVTNNSNTVTSANSSGTGSSSPSGIVIASSSSLSLSSFTTSTAIPLPTDASAKIIPPSSSSPVVVAPPTVTTPIVRTGAYIPPHLRRQMSMNTGTPTTTTALSSTIDQPFGNSTVVTSSSTTTVITNHTTASTVPPPPLPRTEHTIPNVPLNLPPRRKISTTIEGYGEGQSVYGIWSAQGARSRMEDAHIALTDLYAYSNQMNLFTSSSSTVPKDDPSMATAITQGMSYYAIFDGHSGRYAADYAREYIVRTFVQNLTKYDNPSVRTTNEVTNNVSSLPISSSSSTAIIHEALTQAFLTTDKSLLRYADDFPHKREYRSGTTAIAITIKDNEILVASLGDCRAVLVRPRVLTAHRTTACILPLPSSSSSSSSVVPSPTTLPSPTSTINPSKDTHPLYLYDEVSIEHTPQNEIVRVEQAGGWVKIEKELSVSKIRHMDRSDPFVARRLDRGQDKLWTIVSRICGELGVSRALGDPDYKGIERMNQSTNDWAWPIDRSSDQKRFLNDLVLGIPEVTRIDIGHEHELLRKLSTMDTKGTVETDATGIDSPSSSSANKILVPFLIVACDGLWEVMSSSEAMEIVIDYMQQNDYGTLQSVRKDSVYRSSNASGTAPEVVRTNDEHTKDGGYDHIPTGAARRLVEMALKLGTSDNVTVMVIMLPPKETKDA